MSGQRLLGFAVPKKGLIYAAFINPTSLRRCNVAMEIPSNPSPGVMSPLRTLSEDQVTYEEQGFRLEAEVRYC